MRLAVLADIRADCRGAQEDRRHPESARPTPDALAMDVFSRVRKYVNPFDFHADHDQRMKRYAFLLIE